MPLLIVFRILFSLLSLAVLGGAGYLLWSWYDGDVVRDAYGALVLTRDEWRLYAGLALLAWSFLGRYLVVALLARGDTDPTSTQRGAGRMLAGGKGPPLYVESLGADGAPVIVFTHGWGLDSTIWHYAKRDLAKRFKLILWDLRGLGRSKLPAGGKLSLPDLAADLARVIEEAGDRPVVLVGHSIGGMTIQTLARDNPELFKRRVLGAVLIHTTYTNPLKTMILSRTAQALRHPVLEPMMRLTVLLQPLAWLSAWQSYFSGSTHLSERLGFGAEVTRSQLEHAAVLATRNPPGVQAKGTLAMFRWDATGALAAMPVPVLVIGGDIDIITKAEASREIAKTALQATLTMVEGGNHMTFLERAGAYNTLIDDFAKSVQPKTDAQKKPAIATAP